jgi:hypothetical protein
MAQARPIRLPRSVFAASRNPQNHSACAPKGEDGAVGIDLIERARSGDQAAFEQLVGLYRGEVQIHCYLAGALPRRATRRPSRHCGRPGGVITLAGERVSAITRFGSGVFARLGLPRTLAD